jgi:Holliday junction resolvase RusA-like endonuclease
MSNDEFLVALEAVRNGKEPSLFGSLEFRIPGKPISVQARKGLRDEYDNRVKESIGEISYLLIGEIHIEFCWHISAKSRYETDTSSDIDNALKPTIDALAGPDRLFIDDCQVRSLYVAWVHSESGDEHIDVKVNFSPDDWLSRSNIIFIDLGNGLCTLAPRNAPPEAKRIWADFLGEGQIIKSELLSTGVSYLYVAGFLGCPRPFHKTRTKGFEVVTIKEYIASS